MYGILKKLMKYGLLINRFLKVVLLQKGFKTISGIRNFIPDLNTPIFEVPTAYDFNFWKNNEIKKQKLF